ncbi:sortase [Bifidobacterium sp. DSM 109959]|uniref:Sortase n=1 Tax=Bifidobacterium olomucense TaxID=2675324 RepID=A0A7Y0HWR6_9BIFI|nr:sortase [Bifidobacterium sp. DSM 109959]
MGAHALTRRDARAALSPGERRRRRLWFVAHVVADLMLLVAFLMTVNLVYSQVRVNLDLAREANRTAELTNAWPAKDKVAAWNEANEYNKRNVDITTTTFDGTYADSDAAYQDALNLDGTGVMAQLLIPSISVNVPVRHGVDLTTLAEAVGHVYGTDLPTGEPGTFSVIAGHSGSVRGMYFTRVPQLRKGDWIYVELLGKRMGYRIDKIETVLPEETEKLRALYNRNSDEARLTLYTCTPVGINTHRLLVSAVRVPDAPDPKTQVDPVWPSGVIIVGSIIAFLLLLAIIVPNVMRAYRLLRRNRRAKHRAGLATGSDKVTVVSAPLVPDPGSEANHDTDAEAPADVGDARREPPTSEPATRIGDH